MILIFILIIFNNNCLFFLLCFDTNMVNIRRNKQQFAGAFSYWFLPKLIIKFSGILLTNCTIRINYIAKIQRCWSSKHPESVHSPRQKLHWHNMCHVTVLELLSLWKFLNFQEEVWKINCNKFQSISALSTRSSFLSLHFRSPP